MSVLDILSSDALPIYLHGTNVVLILKSKNAKSISDYRPISLSNVLYRIVSKILANQLKCVLHDVVLENQSAFI